MKTKTITWETFVEILEIQNPIVRGDYGNADYFVGSDNDVIDFIQDIDGEDVVTTVLQGNNENIVFEDNTLYLKDSEGDEVEFTFSQTVPFDFSPHTVKED